MPLKACSAIRSGGMTRTTLNCIATTGYTRGCIEKSKDYLNAFAYYHMGIRITNIPTFAESLWSRLSSLETSRALRTLEPLSRSSPKRAKIRT